MNEEAIRRRAEEILKMSGDEFRRDMEAKRRERRQFIDTLARRAFGSSFDETFRSLDEVSNGLQSAEPKTRTPALWALLWSWRRAVGSEHLSRVEEMAITDPDDDVRACALFVLGSLFEDTCDRRIGAVLATVIRDEAEPRVCRSFAYGGLALLAGRDWERGTSEFPEAVNWSLVHDYLP